MGCDVAALVCVWSRGNEAAFVLHARAAQFTLQQA